MSVLDLYGDNVLSIIMNIKVQHIRGIKMSMLTSCLGGHDIKMLITLPVRFLKSCQWVAHEASLCYLGSLVATQWESVLLAFVISR